MKRNTWIVLGLAFFLGVIYFITKDKKVSVGIKKLVIPEFVKDAVDKIEIGGKENIHLQKIDDEWVVRVKSGENIKNVPASKNNVDALLSAVLEIKPSYYVTELPEKYADLGLGEDAKTAVRIFSNDKILSALEIGKTASGSGRYVKLSDENEVYAASGSFWKITRNKVSEWRDKKILPVLEEDITKIDFSSNDNKKLLLIKDIDSEQWQIDNEQKGLSSNFRPSFSAIKNMAKAIFSLRASGFIDEETKLDKPDYELVLTNKEGKEIKVSFYGPKDDNYLVKRDDESQIFQVSKYSFDRFNKSLDDLRDLFIAKFDSEDLSKIIINSPSQKIILSKKEGAWNLENPKDKLQKDFEFDPISVDEMLDNLKSIKAKRVASKKDVAKIISWVSKPLVEFTDKNNKKINFYFGELKSDKNYSLAKGNIDDEIYVIDSKDIAAIKKGLVAFQKVEFDMPPIDPNTKGLESLPPDIRKKLMDAAKKSQ